MKCSKCGNEFNERDLFCNKCGNKLKEEAKEEYKRPKNKKIIIIFILILIIIGSVTFYILKNHSNDYNNQDTDEKIQIENVSKIKEDFVNKLNSENDKKYKDSIKAMQYNTKDTLRNVNNYLLQNNNLEVKYIEKYKEVDIYYINKNNNEQFYYIYGGVGEFGKTSGQLIGKNVDGFYICYDSYKSDEMNTKTIMYYENLNQLKNEIDFINNKKNIAKTLVLPDIKNAENLQKNVVGNNVNGTMNVEINPEIIIRDINNFITAFSDKLNNINVKLDINIRYNYEKQLYFYNFIFYNYSGKLEEFVEKSNNYIIMYQNRHGNSKDEYITSLDTTEYGWRQSDAYKKYYNIIVNQDYSSITEKAVLIKSENLEWLNESLDNFNKGR